MKAKLILSTLLTLAAAMSIPTSFEDRPAKTLRNNRSKDSIPSSVPHINRNFTRSSTKRWKGSRKSGGPR